MPPALAPTLAKHANIGPADAGNFLQHLLSVFQLHFCVRYVCTGDRYFGVCVLLTFF